MDMIKIELAHVEDGNVFILAAMANQPAVTLAARLAIDGRSFDLAGSFRRFPRREPNAKADFSQGLLIAKPLRDAQVGVLVGQEAVLTFSNPAGENFEARLLLRHEPLAFRHMVVAYDRVIHALLEKATRQEAYLLENTIWPQATERSEVVDLAALSPTVLLDIDFSCVPLPGVLVTVGFLVDPLHEVAAIDVFHGEDDEPYDRRLLRYERALPTPDPGDLRAASGFVIILEFNETDVPHDDFVLLLASQSRVWTRSLRPRSRLDRGLDALAGHMAALDADTRLLIIEEVALVAAGRADAPAGSRLHAMQMAVADELPTELSRPSLGLRLNVDLAAAINLHGVFLLGWAAIEPEVVRAVELRVPGPAGDVRFDVSGHWVLHQRMDVWVALKQQGEQVLSDQLGYLCVARLSGVAVPAGAYLAVHMVDDSIRRMKLKLKFAALDPIEAIKPLLTSFPQTHLRLREVLDRHIGPAVTALWAQRRTSSRLPQINDFGAMPAHPECSLIIPLYGRYDFIEHQMARFVDDPALHGQELIYVVDDPSIYDAVRQLAPEIELLYGLPFRLVYAGRNQGFAGATNLGVAHSRGQYVLLMNSDVIPRRFNWLSELLAAYRHLPDVGAVGPKLLYEDSSLQHAGMRFVRYPLWADMWVNEHPGKGLTDQTGDEPIECDTITGACLLIDAALYRSCGGFSEDYIIGDFEDSDLCLKLLQAGRRNWLIPSVALYHLERQSQPLIGEGDWRNNLTLLNCWTHHQRWDATISRRAATR
jgi:GT2 family glycosyltransferase